MDDAGIPDTFVSDFASKQTGTNTDLMKFICRLHKRLEKGRGSTKTTVPKLRSEKSKWNERIICVMPMFLHNCVIMA